MAHRFAVLFLLAFTALSPAAGQQKPDTPPTKPTPPPTTPPTREQQPGQREQQRQDFQRPIYVTGKVVLEDGTPLPNGVRVEMLFNGQVRRQDYTRIDGSFSFDLGGSQNASFMSDASVSGSADDPFGGQGVGGSSGPRSNGLGRVDLSGWEVRASLPGYRSDIIVLQSRSALDNPDVGIVVLRPLAQVKATTISLVSMRAPRKAQEAFEKAFKAVNKKKPDNEKAVKELDKAIVLYPEYAAAWNLLGQIRQSANDVPGAREAYQKAIAADEKFLTPYVALADIQIQQKEWDEAARLTGHLLQLNPYVTHGQFLNAVANYQLGKLDLAEESIRRVQTGNDANHYPISHYVLGAILVGKGNVAGAATEFQVFIKQSPDHKYAQTARQQLEQWQKEGVVAATKTPAAPAQAKP